MSKSKLSRIKVSEKFTDDFMVQFTGIELKSLISRFVIPKNKGMGGTTKLPFVFAEYVIERYFIN